MRYIVDRLQEIVNFIFIFFHIFIQREPGSFLPLEAEICIILSETSPVIFCVHSGYVLVYYTNLNFPDQKKKKLVCHFIQPKRVISQSHLISATVTKFQTQFILLIHDIITIWTYFLFKLNNRSTAQADGIL